MDFHRLGPAMCKTFPRHDVIQWHDDGIKLKHFPRHWPFARGIHRLPMNSPHKGQWRGALMFSLICASTNSWANKWDTGDLRRRRAHYDVIVMISRLHSQAGIHSTLSGPVKMVATALKTKNCHDGNLVAIGGTGKLVSERLSVFSENIVKIKTLGSQSNLY